MPVLCGSPAIPSRSRCSLPSSPTRGKRAQSWRTDSSGLENRVKVHSSRPEMELEIGFIDIPPRPLAVRERLHDWMPGLPDVGGGVPTWRRIAAAYVTEGLADSTLNAFVAGVAAFCAAATA